MGVSDAIFDNWRHKYGGMEVADAKRLKALEAENTEPPFLSSCCGIFSPSYLQMPRRIRRLLRGHSHRAWDTILLGQHGTVRSDRAMAQSSVAHTA
jgi:hypothetical protein